MKSIHITILVLISSWAFSQDDEKDYYYEIPDYPESYHAGSVSARVVDGLGFRYYWATEGLTEENLVFRPIEGARSIEETIDHIVSLTQILKDAVNERPFEGVDLEGLSYSEKRAMTLENIQLASQRLKSSTAEDLAKYDMIFSSGNEYPFWNLLNGPIADAINHVGQIITLRRTNGNPINQNISVLRGKMKN